MSSTLRIMCHGPSGQAWGYKEVKLPGRLVASGAEAERKVFRSRGAGAAFFWLKRGAWQNSSCFAFRFSSFVFGCPAVSLREQAIKKEEMSWPEKIIPYQV